MSMKHTGASIFVGEAYINAALILDMDSTNCAFESHGLDLETGETTLLKRLIVLNCNTNDLLVISICQ